MRLGVLLEAVFCRSADGRFWANPTLGNAFWDRYLAVFEEVVIIARLKNDSAVQGQVELKLRAGLSLDPVPYYRGPRQFVSSSGRVHRSVRKSVRACEVVLARVPSTLGMLAFPHVRTRSTPLGLEVVGDPGDVFSRGSVGGRLSPVYRWSFGTGLRWMCGKADGVSYVTEYSLQRKYPPSRGALTTHYSSVALSRDDYAEQPRVSFAGQPVRLIAVGSLSQLYKGPDVLLDALAAVQETLAIRCVWVGSGRFLEPMRRRAAELGLSDRVEFIGPVERRTSVRHLLDTADVFVMPSRVEGLPRAMIEAMARGLPCIGTRVGGIPELLPDDALIEPDSPEELSNKIIEFASSPESLVRFSEINLREAHQYAEEILGPRRERFYAHLRRVAETAGQPRSLS